MRKLIRSTVALGLLFGGLAMARADDYGSQQQQPSSNQGSSQYGQQPGQGQSGDMNQGQQAGQGQSGEMNQGQTGTMGSQTGTMGSQTGSQAQTGTLGAQAGAMGEASFIGKVKNIDRKKNTVTVELPLSPNATITRDGAQASLKDVKSGDDVRVDFTPDPSGVTQLNVESKQMMKKGMNKDMNK